MKQLTKKPIFCGDIKTQLPPLPEISERLKSERTPSQKILSPTLSKESSKINCEDFWSNRMKAQIEKLKKNNSIEINTANNSPKSLAAKFPILEERFKRSSLLYNYSFNSSSKQGLEYITTIDKIIDECNIVRKSTRKFSYEIFNTSKSIKQDLVSFAKNIT